MFRSATLLAQLRLRRQPSGEAAALLHLPLSLHPLFVSRPGSYPIRR
ncbi:MAG: hypothetical protein J2P37_18160 [Ktedonobacteraceae bacterium]|nr:hypothetical protein [Ktedonobacteraceae bacterium]MBO0794558.1 hypothetical protein [Ktedonobacteraceae bacterium]